MSDESVEEYLSQLEATRVVRARIAEIREAYRNLMPTAELDSILISESVDDDGQRVYQSLWLYGGGILAEAKSFMTGIDLDATPWMAVSYAQLKALDLDVTGDPIPKSRANLRFQLTNSVVGTINASGNNCAELLRFARLMVFPRLVPQPGVAGG